MKLNINDIGGDIVKDNETYLLKDNKTLKNLVLSSTDMKPNMSTCLLYTSPSPRDQRGSRMAAYA